MIGRCLAVLALGMVACERESLPPSAWTGLYIDYGQSEGLQPCAGTRTYTDNFVPFLAGELGLEPTRASFRWLDTAEYDAQNCPEASQGCAFATEAQSRNPFHLHEQVHALTAAYDMNGLPFYTEGLATAYDWFGDGALRRFAYLPKFDPRNDIREQMTVRSSELDYGIAGVFATVLLARHGPEKFIDVSRRARYGDDLATLERDFAEVYGVALADEAERFRHVGELPCDESMFAVRPYDCDMPEVLWTGDTWVHAGILACDVDDVAGGIGPDQAWPSVRSVTLTVPRDGIYHVRRFSDGDDEVQVLLGDCFACPWQHDDQNVYDGDATVQLSAGTYFLRVVGNSEAAPLVGLVITPEE